MYFTKAGPVFAVIGLIWYLVIDFNLSAIATCMALGVLCEISKHLSNSQSTTADNSKTV